MKMYIAKLVCTQHRHVFHSHVKRLQDQELNPGKQLAEPETSAAASTSTVEVTEDDSKALDVAEEIKVRARASIDYFHSTVRFSGLRICDPARIQASDPDSI